MTFKSNSAGKLGSQKSNSGAKSGVGLDDREESSSSSSSSEPSCASCDEYIEEVKRQATLKEKSQSFDLVDHDSKP